MGTVAPVEALVVALVGARRRACTQPLGWSSAHAPSTGVSRKVIGKLGV